MSKQPLLSVKDMLPRPQATTFLQQSGFPIAKTTLEKAAHRGFGPPFVRWNGRVYYDRNALLDWAQSRLQIVGEFPPFVERNEADAAIAA